jgi:hypothetical protein
MALRLDRDQHFSIKTIPPRAVGFVFIRNILTAFEPEQDNNTFNTDFFLEDVMNAYIPA